MREEKLTDFDYMVSDLSYYVGIDTGRAGAVLCNSKENFAKINCTVCMAGYILQPMDCFVNMRGLKTLHVRLDEQFLNKHFIL